ncbi:hypothetical protein H4R33_000437 [Dimargaris cristalligena]|uniref:Uncharacterized protein n=1 Tax=Dimargaris cristalligena TaxID=215637 RepID=A0A4P9ZZ84_9FUNG|nr:hypothetical protein H4R33_000437 [Dimargaris cristalligena]RKP38718.1 hypothetical protein BJ085DRAFT_33117 [Dimargaris cristalligena]|eukprot:RKP38718.1 hypothetical protein BJ085DRAFT_33117 [Dimargaris cristalligena]
MRLLLASAVLACSLTSSSADNVCWYPTCMVRRADPIAKPNAPSGSNDPSNDAGAEDDTENDPNATEDSPQDDNAEGDSGSNGPDAEDGADGGDPSATEDLAGDPNAEEDMEGSDPNAEEGTDGSDPNAADDSNGSESSPSSMPPFVVKILAALEGVGNDMETAPMTDEAPEAEAEPTGGVKARAVDETTSAVRPVPSFPLAGLPDVLDSISTRPPAERVTLTSVVSVTAPASSVTLTVTSELSHTIEKEKTTTSTFTATATKTSTSTRTRTVTRTKTTTSSASETSTTSTSTLTSTSQTTTSLTSTSFLRSSTTTASLPSHVTSSDIGAGGSIVHGSGAMGGHLGLLAVLGYWLATVAW